MNCDCASRFEVRLARASDYSAFKRVLDRGKHPAFIGRDSFTRNSTNGGALFYELDGEAVAVSLINPHYGILLALNVSEAHRGHGLGGAIVNFLVPNFVRALEDKAAWFEARGYRRISTIKRGIRLNTQLMARSALFTLAGKLRKAWAHDAAISSGGGGAELPRKHSSAEKEENDRLQ